ncbi:STAS domain-containing protein [Zhongshania sp.]|uniref:STAS domain-containing protein n=1 Tax=Zhongshania sp. TaxID=1971902 RepID=UPI0035660086
MIRYAETDNTLILHFCDEVRYTQCGPLNALLDSAFSRGKIKNVLIDLTDASSIDSTGLGLLAKISNHISTHFKHKTAIFTTNPDITRTLDTAGFSDIFVILKQKPQLAINENDLPENFASDVETAEMILNAHRDLAGLNEKNWQEFRGVVSALEKELNDKKSAHDVY